MVDIAPYILASIGAQGRVQLAKIALPHLQAVYMIVVEVAQGGTTALTPKTANRQDNKQQIKDYYSIHKIGAWYDTNPINFPWFWILFLPKKCKKLIIKYQYFK